MKTNSKRKDWRNIFKKELVKYGEGSLYLKGLRLREDYTQAEIGKMIGISPSHISAIECGHRPISKNIAQRLAKVFNTNYRKFL